MAILSGSSGDDTISGTSSSDIIVSGSGDDVISAGDGSDIIIAGSGDDTISGGSGNDIINGGTGDDIINGDAGADLINGGTGNDILMGDGGTDIIVGGEGNDQIEGGGGSDLLSGGSGSDLFIYKPNFGNDIITDFKVGVDFLRFNGVNVSSITLTEISGSTLLTLDSQNTILLVGVKGVSLVDLVLNSPPQIINQSLSILENSPSGQVVGTVAASDPEGSPLTYAIVGGSSLFTIDSATGIITANSSLDYEAQSSYVLQVQVTDDGGLQSQAQITINVGNVNEAPTDIALSNASVNENAANGTVVGDLAAMDPDAGDSATFTLVDNAGGRFAISGNQLVVAGPLDYEAATSHSITVHVVDSGGLSYDKTFAINVNNVNEAPTDITLSNAAVNENAANGTVVGDLAALDPDAGDSATFTLVDDAGGRFAIIGNQLVVAGPLDYEAATSHSITVHLVDSGGLSYDKTFAINVNNVNEAPTDITLSNAAVNENAANGTVVGDLAALDPDAGDSATFTLVDNAGGRFAISGNQLVVAGPLDYEAATSHSITVHVVDSGGLSYDKIFAINVNNVNEAPIDITLSNAAVSENAANGAVVGDLAVLDPDAGDSATFTLVDNAGGRFAISGNQVVVAGPLDYEAATSHSITVHVVDSGGLSYDKTFAINVNNVNEAPTDITLSNSIIAQGVPIGSVVGDLASIDPDFGDISTFSIVDPSGMFAINGNQIVTASSLLVGNYILDVQATDAGGLTFTKQFNLTVSNLPPDIAAQAYAINENSPAGSTVGTVVATDPNPGDTVTYSFVVDPTLASQINQAQANLDLWLNALSQNPPSTALSTAVFLFLFGKVANAWGTLLNLKAQDPSNFVIDPHTGVITVASGINLDYETIKTYNLTASAIDSQGLSSQAAITINLNNLAEPALFTMGNDTVDFNLVSRGYSGSPISALDGNDTVILPDINHYLTSGFPFAQLFDAGAGNDTIITGNSFDNINGGAGADHFLMKIGGMDSIDFTVGVDFLDLATGSPSLADFGRNYIWDITTEATTTTVLYFDSTGRNYVSLPDVLLNSTWSNVTLNGAPVNIGGPTTAFIPTTNNIIYNRTADLNINSPTGYNTIVTTDASTKVTFSGNFNGATTVQFGNGGNSTYGGTTSSFHGNLNIISGSGNDELVITNNITSNVDGGSLYIDGGAGNDKIQASDFNGLSLHFVGGDGNDVLIASVDPAMDSSFNLIAHYPVLLEGNNGDDILVADASENMTLNGGAGNDRMILGNNNHFGNNTWIGGAGNDYMDLTNTASPTARALENQHITYNVTWDGSQLISNDGTDFVKSFLNGTDNIVLNVTNTAAVAPTTADILNAITMGQTSIDTATSPLVPSSFYSGNSLFPGDGHSAASGADLIINSSPTTPDTLVTFGNTSVYFLDTNLTSTPISSLVDVHFV